MGFGGSNLLEGILTKGMTMSSRGCNRVLTGEDGPLEVLEVFIVEMKSFLFGLHTLLHAHDVNFFTLLPDKNNHITSLSRKCLIYC